MRFDARYCINDNGDPFELKKGLRIALTGDGLTLKSPKDNSHFGYLEYERSISRVRVPRY